MFKKIEEFGFKKMVLLIHYIVAIIISIIYFGFCLYATNEPVRTFNIHGITQIYKYIIIYCVIVAIIVAILCMYDTMQTMNRKDTKFDFIAFFIGFCMLVTSLLIIVAIVFMFTHEMNEIQANMWKYLIGIFGSMFICEAGGGYIYNIFKKKYAKDIPQAPQVEAQPEPEPQPQPESQE